ncbi:hypothetical protein Glove_329g43 [Diversispora epigaea]|uniref:Origin recognition complex subunit 3 n=1 Tax=Diversispora epigaea TaxID=1348612 RepID=A0A397HQB4_9GLOM|nr:hypothetical protein Glove_329g43 [Diversispora epigaea]
MSAPLFKSEIPFELLLDIKESPKAAKARYLDYRESVQSLENITNNFSFKINESVVDDLCLFVENENSNNRNCGNHQITSRIPPGLPTAFALILAKMKSFFKGSQINLNKFNKIVSFYLIQNFSFKINESVVDDLCLFVENENSNNRNCGNHQITSRFDTSENEKFFQGVANKLEQVQQNRVVLLDSSICSDLDKMMKNTIEKFLGKPLSGEEEDNEGGDKGEDEGENEDEDEDEDEDGGEDEGEGGDNDENDENDESDENDENDENLAHSHINRKTNKQGQQDNMEVDEDENNLLTISIDDVVDLDSVIQWCESYLLANSGESSSMLNFIIIIRDFECFVPSVLEGFIHIFSEYQNRIPIIFILGISTGIQGIDAIHNNYSYSIERLLRPTTFYLKSQKSRFDVLLSQCMIENIQSVKFGEKAFEFLQDSFIGTKFSLISFVSRYKYAIYQHFSKNPLSILSIIEPENVDSRFSFINKNHIEMIRMQSSFRKYVESIIHLPEEALQLLNNDNYLKNMLPKFLQDMKIYHQKFGAAFELVNYLQKFLSLDSGLLKARHELYSLSLKEPGLGENFYIRKFVDVLMNLEIKEFGELFQTMIEYFKGVSMHLGIMSQECKEIEEFLDQLRKESNTIQISKNYQKLKLDFRNYLLNFFEENLRHYSTNTLYEIFYYQENPESVFTPNLRAAVHTALGLPTEYIHCSCCNLDDDEEDDDDEENNDKLDPRDQIISTHPDTCILYKLHLQCGKLININDWFGSFETVISKENMENEKINEMELRARFIKSYEELKMLGIISSPIKKKDHVKRTTWGFS